METIVVTGRTSQSSSASPYPTATLLERDIRNGRPTLSLGEVLAPVPGVFVTSRGNFAQDTRVSIRGFGARSAFGVRGIRVILDGIPLTLPDGQSQLDSLDLANIGRVEVLRGPAGSLYGNAAGGVLYLSSGEFDLPEVEAVSVLGGFETFKLSARGRARLDDTAVSVFASRTQVEGFREQSRTEQIVAQGQTHTDISSDVRLATVVHYVNAPVADDPGGLTPTQFREAPSQAAETNQRFSTGESVSQLQAGTRLTADLGSEDNHRIEVSAHAGLRAFANAIPFRTVAFSRDFFGGLLIYRWQEPNWLSGHRLSLGAEAQGQRDQRRNEGNEGGRPNGTVLVLQTERAESYGVFVQESLRFVEWFELLASARYDRVDFEVEDDLRDDGDASGSRSFDRFTGQFGLVLQPLEELSFFLNVSESYETPTFTELVASAPGGVGLSSTLEAQEALSLEVGTRGQILSRIAFEASLFAIELENELIASEDEENRSIFTNAGASQRLGAEAWVRIGPIRDVELVASYSWLLSTFEDDAEDRSGNQIPGLPEHRVFTRLRFDNGVLFAAAELEWVEARFANDANTVEAPAHTLGELRSGLRFSMGDNARGELSVGIRNLFNVDYVDNVRVNAFGDRFFEPGAPLHVFGALRIRLLGS